MTTLASLTGVGFGPESPGMVAALCCLLLVISFFFSGTETAFFSLQKVELQRLQSGSRTGEKAAKLLENKPALITTILLGNETANIMLSSTVAAAIIAVNSDLTYLSILVVTPVLVIISEITPKVIAYRFNSAWVRLVIWPMLLVFAILAPLRIIISGLVTALAALFGVKKAVTETGLQEDELLNIFDRGAESGVIDEKERSLIEAVFEFDDTPIDKLMTPLHDIEMIPIDISWKDLSESVRTLGMSRIPVYGDGPEEIRGVLLVKDLLSLRGSPPASLLDVEEILVQPAFIPRSKPADELLAIFLDQHLHIALVVDEHGTLVGLVTMEDLLEGLMGDEEGDSLPREQTDSCRKVDAVSFEVDGRMDIEAFESETGISIQGGPYHTVAGYLLDVFGRLPEVNETIFVNGHKFIILELEGRRIASVLVQNNGASFEVTS